MCSTTERKDAGMGPVVGKAHAVRKVTMLEIREETDERVCSIRRRRKGIARYVVMLERRA